MSIGGTIFFVLALGITALLIAAPLLAGNWKQSKDDQRIAKQHERLLVYYERMLTNLRDLDEDHATGKMADETYTLERDEWLQRGVQVLKAIDGLADESLIPGDIRDDAAVDEAIDDAIEGAIASYQNAH